MNVSSIVASPPYSLILLLDPTKGVVPRTFAEGLIAATSSCVAVGCRAEDDGSTEIKLGPADLVDPGHEPAFSGEIETPSKILEVQSVVGTTLFRTPVRGRRTLLSIWVNDDREPDRISVGIRAD